MGRTFLGWIDTAENRERASGCCERENETLELHT